MTLVRISRFHISNCFKFSVDVFVTSSLELMPKFSITFDSCQRYMASAYTLGSNARKDGSSFSEYHLYL